MKHFICILIFSLVLSPAYTQKKSVELSHYLFPEFTKGTVLMKTGVRHENMLNYNSLTEEMIFETGGKKLAISKSEIDQIDTVFIKGRKFVILNKKFIELMYNKAVVLYAEHKCSVRQPGKPAGYGGTSETTASKSYSSIYAGGQIYELNLPDDYVTKPYTFFWIKRDGKLQKFITLKQLMKIYEDKKDIFKSYVKDNNVKYEDNESILKLIEFLETH